MSWSNPKWKYRDSFKTRQPGYLARRMKAYARLQRIKARKSSLNVTTMPIRKVG